MKKVIGFVVCCIAVLTVTSCGEKKVVGADGKEYYSVEDACRNHDFEAAYQFAEKYDDGEDLVKHKDFIFNQEMLYLVSLNTKEASNRVIYLLAETPMEGLPYNENSIYENSGNQKNKVENYINSVGYYNKRCNSILDLAISQGNIELAKKLIDLYKQEIEYSSSGILGQDLKTGKFHETSKQAAKEKLEKAIKEGKFNNKEEQ